MIKLNSNSMATYFSYWKKISLKIRKKIYFEDQNRPKHYRLQETYIYFKILYIIIKIQSRFVNNYAHVTFSFILRGAFNDHWESATLKFLCLEWILFFSAVISLRTKGMVATRQSLTLNLQSPRLLVYLIMYATKTPFLVPLSFGLNTL